MAGLALFARHSMAQHDDDALFARMAGGASVAAQGLSKINVPTLIVIGARDQTVTRIVKEL